jgi:hypothetical protein
MTHFSGDSPMEKRSRFARTALALGAALALAALPIPSLALGDADGAVAQPRNTGETLSSGEWLPLASASAYAMANPEPLEDRSGYDSSYLFAMTRGVSGSTLITALKPPLFLFTIPLDIVLLPFSAIAGFF